MLPFSAYSEGMPAIEGADDSLTVCQGNPDKLLMDAVDNDDFSLAKACIKQKANMPAAYEYALRKGKMDFATLFIAKGMYIDKEELLYDAVKICYAPKEWKEKMSKGKDQCTILNWLISRGADVKKADAKKSFFMEATKFSHGRDDGLLGKEDKSYEEMVRFLIKNGASVNPPPKYDEGEERILVRLAELEAHISIFQILIQSGASLTDRNPKKETVLRSVEKLYYKEKENLRSGEKIPKWQKTEPIHVSLAKRRVPYLEGIIQFLKDKEKENSAKKG